MSDFHLFIQHLSQPEYVHVLLNPLPLYGMAAGAFMLVVSWLAGSRAEETAALWWIVLAAIVTWFAVQYGERGYDRVLSMSTSHDAQLWLKVHMARAEKFEAVFYAAGVSALAAIVSRRKWPHVSKWLSVVTLLLTIFSAGIAGWISQAGGQVRHSEFREGPPPANQIPADH